MTDDEFSPQLQADLDEALLALEELIFENPEEAITMYDSLPEEVQSRPEYRLTLARAHQALEQLEAARDIALGVLADEPGAPIAADAHHLLGDLVEDLGDSEAANRHFVQTLTLDRQLFAEHSTFNENELVERVRKIAQTALTETRAAVKKTEVVLFPSAQSVEQGIDPRCYSFVDQDPDGQILWTIYAANIDAEYGDLEELGEFDEYVLEELKSQLGASDED